MYLPEPLRHNPFRFRKRKSANSILYGDHQSKSLNPVTSATSNGGSTGSQYSHSGIYGHRPAQEYLPDPGAMQAAPNYYEAYETLPASGSPQPPITGPGHSRTKQPHQVKYEDGLLNAELFELQLKLVLEHFERLRIAPIDNGLGPNEITEGITQESAADVLRDILASARSPEGVLDQLAANIGDQDVLQQTGVEIPAFGTGADYGSLSPSTLEPLLNQGGMPANADFFEAQVQAMEAQFAEPQATDPMAEMETSFSAQQMAFEFFQEPSPMTDQVFMEGPSVEITPTVQDLQPLESIVEANDMMLPNPVAEIGEVPNEDMISPLAMEQQMYGTADQYEAPLPDAEQMPPEMMPQGYDPQMQQMLNPYMMPDAMAPEPMDGPGGGP